jgi:hypothetical protein
MSSEITITIQNDRSVRAERPRGGQAGSKESRIQVDKLTSDTISLFGEWLAHGKISKRKELEILGTFLYRMLFSTEVKLFFDAALKEAQQKGERLRLQLSFDEDVDDLASLPWEYLYYPDTKNSKGYFFATAVDLGLSRYMPLLGDRASIKPEDSPLRVLIVVSRPQDEMLGPVVADDVIEPIKNMAEKIQLKIDILYEATIDKFLKALSDNKPHVLHFIGHGRFKDKKGEIAMVDEDEKSLIWVSDEQFADFFTFQTTIPRLVFLHLCEGATVDFNANFGGLAPKLIRSLIQAVVAMQYPISNKAALAFSRAFYRSLAEGKPIDDAVQDGRRTITMSDPKAYDSRIFGTPVLYMHSFDGIIQPAGESRVPVSAKGYAEPTPVSQEIASAQAITKIINGIKTAAYTEAGRLKLDIAVVVNEIEVSDWGKDPATIRKTLYGRIEDSQSEDMISIYTAMLRAMKKHSDVTKEGK